MVGECGAEQEAVEQGHEFCAVAVRSAVGGKAAQDDPGEDWRPGAFVARGWSVAGQDGARFRGPVGGVGVRESLQARRAAQHCAKTGGKRRLNRIRSLSIDACLRAGGSGSIGANGRRAVLFGDLFEKTVEEELALFGDGAQARIEFGLAVCGLGLGAPG